MKYKKYLDLFNLCIALSIASYGAWVDSVMIRTLCYGAIGLFFLWVSMRRMRLAELGVAIHMLPVSYRVALLQFFDDWPGWTRLHTITIAIAAALVAADFYIDQRKRSVERERPDS